MNENVISLRQYIDNRNQINTLKVQTFCRLMKMVSVAVEKEERKLIRINLDEIKINITTGEIIFSDNLFATSDNLDKTMVGFNTGISLMADRKSSLEHKSVAFALMMLGWYCNQDESSVLSDIDVLDNFETYMNKVPTWLHGFFINIFRKMNYNESFSDYYDRNFTEKIKNDIKDAFASYNLTDEQLNRISSVIAKKTNALIKEGASNAL